MSLYQPTLNISVSLENGYCAISTSYYFLTICNEKTKLSVLNMFTTFNLSLLETALNMSSGMAELLKWLFVCWAILRCFRDISYFLFIRYLLEHPVAN